MKPSRAIVIGLVMIAMALAAAYYIGTAPYFRSSIVKYWKIGRCPYFKARMYERAGRHDEAEAIYKQMLEQDPNHPDIYVNLAAIQIIKRNPEEAIDLCDKAIALDPKNATAHNNLAVACYMLGNFERAIYHCDQAVEFGYPVKPELIRLLRPYRE